MMAIRITCAGDSHMTGAGWFAGVEAYLQGASYFPLDDVQLIDRGIGGAKINRGYNNISLIADTDPSILIFGYITNTCLPGSGINWAQHQSYVASLVSHYRTELPNTIIGVVVDSRICPWATVDGTKFQDYANTYRYFGSKYCTHANRADFLLDIGMLIEQRGMNSTNIPDGIHPISSVEAAVAVPIAQYLGEQLLAYEALGILYRPTTPRPGAWTPLP